MARAKLDNSAVILSRPRITEKASFLSGDKNPVYTFEVPAAANKIQVKRAIKEKYGLDALRVNIINLPRKKITVRGKAGIKTGVKKALVAVKAGSQIDFL